MSENPSEETMEVKYLRRNIMDKVPIGAVRGVPLKTARSLIERGVAVEYTQEQRKADVAAEKAAKARLDADSEVQRATEAARKQADEARAKELRASQRTPHVPLPDSNRNPATRGVTA
jgi:hypothetical protein